MRFDQPSLAQTQRALIIVSIAITCCLNRQIVHAQPTSEIQPGPGAATGAAPAESQQPVAVRVFRDYAMIHAAPLKIIALASPRLDETKRGEILKMVEDYGKQVAAESEQFRDAVPDEFEVTNKAGKLDDSFRARSDKWFEVNPAAKAEIDRTQKLLLNVFDVLLNDRMRLVDCADQAGMPESKYREANLAVQNAFDQVLGFYHKIESRKAASKVARKDDPKRLDQLTILADVETEKLQAAASIRQKLLDLLPAQSKEQFDEELMKIEAR